MKNYILIGGIGSGKSTVSKMFGELGASCVDMDKVGHDLLRRSDIINAIAATFGADVIDANGEVSRSALAKKAFSSPALTVQLDTITHAPVMEETQRRLDALSKAGTRVAITEFSAYDGPEGTFAPFVKKASGVIAVTAPTRVRVERAVAKGFNANDVRNRIARQATDEQRMVWADIIISNKGGLDDLRSQVVNVWKRISA